MTQAELEEAGFDVQVRNDDMVISTYSAVRLTSRLTAGSRLFNGGLVLPLGGAFKSIVLHVDPDGR